MKVKDVIVAALRFIGRDELAEKVLDGAADEKENGGGATGADGVTEGEAGGEVGGEASEAASAEGATEGETGEVGDGEEAPAALTDEEREVLNALIYCYNSVEDELARLYFPMRTEDKMASDTGIYLFWRFSRRPLRIIFVKSGGKEVKYTATAKGLFTDCKEITVSYEYAPEKKELDGESEFSSLAASEKLLAAGTAAEYCLIDGEASLAEIWESVYRGEIEKLQSVGFSGMRLPPRRWV